VEEKLLLRMLPGRGRYQPQFCIYFGGQGT
jgi:hypothetical protein